MGAGASECTSDPSARVRTYVLKREERAEARRLRADEGLSIKTIAAQLGVAVSSASCWVRDVELTPDQVDRLRAQNPIFDGQRSGQLLHSANARAARDRAQLHGVLWRAGRENRSDGQLPSRQRRGSRGNRAVVGRPAGFRKRGFASPSSTRSHRVTAQAQDAVYGTTRVAVFSTFVVQNTFGAIQTYAGIERPEWLG